MAGRFSGISQAQTSKSGRYLKPGNYELEIHEVTCFESQAQAGRNYFCVEVDVITTTSEEYRPGDRLTWLVDMGKPSALSNCKKFALALDAKSTDADITEELMEALVSSDQPARGVRIGASAHIVKTRAGNDFTEVTWSSRSA